MSQINDLVLCSKFQTFGWYINKSFEHQRGITIKVCLPGIKSIQSDLINTIYFIYP